MRFAHSSKTTSSIRKTPVCLRPEAIETTTCLHFQLQPSIILFIQLRHPPHPSTPARRNRIGKVIMSSSRIVSQACGECRARKIKVSPLTQFRHSSQYPGLTRFPGSVISRNQHASDASNQADSVLDTEINSHSGSVTKVNRLPSVQKPPPIPRHRSAVALHTQ